MRRDAGFEMPAFANATAGEPGYEIQLLYCQLKTAY